MEPKVFSSGKIRHARGFSYPELKKANIDIRLAKNLGLRIDKRRKTVYNENVRLLEKKTKTKKKKEVATPKKKVKKGKPKIEKKSEISQEKSKV